MLLENRQEKVISRRHFLQRVAKYGLLAVAIIGVSWTIGAVGYRYLGNLGWIDSYYNAAMILAGMGPVDILHSDAAKLFASFYALFSGITFLSATSVLFTPFVHRLFHSLHADPDDRSDS